MTGSRIAITDFLLLEYQYNTGVSATAEYSYSIVRSAEDNYVQLIENTNVTGNNVDREHSVVQVGTVGRFVGAGLDSLEQEHSNTLLLNQYSPLHSTVIPMDTIRVYVKSGYNFLDAIQGFTLQAFLLDTTTDVKVKLCHYKFTKEDYSMLRYPKTPIIISEVVYDSYVEVRIPAPVRVSTGSIPLLRDLGLNSTERSVYVSVNTITDAIISPANSGVSYVLGDSKTIALPDVEPINTVLCSLVERPGYFEYGGVTTLQNYSFEDYVYEIMGTGVPITISHSLQVWEHVDGETIMTGDCTTVQTSNFHKTLKFKPLLEYPDSCRAVSVDYSMSILNTKTGHSVIKTASLTTTAVDKFRLSSTGLRLAGDVYAHKVYVTKATPTTVAVTTPTLAPPTTKVVPLYVNVTTIDTLTKEESHIIINPGFSTLHKFTLVNKQDSTIKPVELDSINNYYMVFFAVDGSKVYVPESKTSGVSRTSGELLFSIPADVTTRVSSTTNHKFYLVAKAPSVDDMVLVQGTWELK